MDDEVPDSVRHSGSSTEDDEVPDSVCHSGSSTEDDSPGGFDIGHWNPDAGEGVNEANDLNIGDFNQDGSFSYYMDGTVYINLRKKSKGFEASDFNEFLEEHVGMDNVETLKKYRRSKHWILNLKSNEIREKLLRMWKIEIKDEVCWLTPYHGYEVRGFLHWVPHFMSDDDVKMELRPFGEVVVLENETHPFWNGKIKKDVMYFGLRFEGGMVMRDMPHFLKFQGYRILVIIRGRTPACFHCREFGHSKKDCEKYRDKLQEYCANTEAGRPRTKPRGRRHKKRGEDKKKEDKTNPNSTSTDPARKKGENNKSCLKHRGISKQRVDKRKEEMLVILESLKNWKESATEMVEEVLLETEKNLRILVSEKTETEIEPLTSAIKALLEEMKQITVAMIEQTLKNLKSIVAHHFGLGSNEQLEKLASDFETTKK